MPELTEQELKRKAIASMDNCYLEIGTHIKNVVQLQAIPPALREKIYDQILALVDKYYKNLYKQNGIISSWLWSGLQVEPIIQERIDQLVEFLTHQSFPLNAIRIKEKKNGKEETNGR